MSIWTCYYFVAPIFGTLCFLVGAATLFIVSFGRWRVRTWPQFTDRPARKLEPTRQRIGNYTYFAADAALYIGLGCLVVLLLVLVAYFLAR